MRRGQARRFRIGVVLAALVGLLLLVPGGAVAASVLDQQQPVIDTSGNWVSGIYGDWKGQALAQVVTPAVTGGLTEVDLGVNFCPDITVAIQGVSGGQPDGVTRGSQTTSFSDTYSGTFARVVFDDPVRVVAGVPFALVLTSSGGCGMFPGPVGDSYSGGDASYFDYYPDYPSVWAPFSIGTHVDDLPFRTFVDPDLDVTAPVVRVPSTTIVPASSPRGATVSFAVFASDPDDAATTPSCSPPSGSFFPIGVTTVACQSTDTAGNVGRASFQVDVTAPGADCTLADYPVVKGTSRNLKNANVAGCYLAGADLSGAVATNANFRAADLAGAELVHANLQQADLTGANLVGADLSGVIWDHTTCPDGTVSNSDGGTCVYNLG